MIEVMIQIEKDKVLAEVGKTTGYTGAKMDGDGNAYDRIQTTDDDEEVLERFWNEAASATVGHFRQFVTSSSTNADSGNLEVMMSLSSAYDETLTASVQTSLKSYFVNYIVGKWYKFTNKGEADGYLAEAKRMMDDAASKIYYRKKPKRPTLS